MPCGCKKRMADMKASERRAVRAAARVIEPAHNAVMKMVDRWEGRRTLRKGQPKPRRLVGSVK